MRLVCEARTAGVARLPFLPRAMSLSSGGVPHKKNERREARSTPLKA